MAFQLLSSLALFVAATFQAASQRPSVLSACFLALFGAMMSAAYLLFLGGWAPWET